MKCTTTREQLQNPLAHAERSTGKALTLPVLSCVLLEVHDGVLSISATNLEMGIRFSLPVADAVNGKVAVSGVTLSHVIASLPSGTSLTLEAKEGYIEVKSVGAVSRITVQDAEEFPQLPTVEGGTTITLPVPSIREVLEHVSFCASTSIIKPELASVFIHPQGTTLTAAATDSFRLAEKKVTLAQPVSIEPFLIPARLVPELLRVLGDIRDIVDISLNEHQLSFSTPGMFVTMRLTVGTFPDYTAIIPKEFITEATMLVFDIDRTLKKAAVFADQFFQTTLTFEPDTSVFSVHTENAVVGETTDIIPATVTGDSLTIKFNHKYLADVFHMIHTDSVLLLCSGQSTPAIVRPKGDESFLYLVMPMNR